MQPALAPPVTVTRASPLGGGPLAAELSVLEEVVKRVSWGGDRRRGVARIELGGEHAGTAIVVRGEGRDVSLRIEVRRGGDAGALPERLRERLHARGLSVTDIELG